jgi:hypothetical protein
MQLNYPPLLLMAFFAIASAQHLDKKRIYSVPSTRSALSNPAARIPECLTA